MRQSATKTEKELGMRLYHPKGHTDHHGANGLVVAWESWLVTVHSRIRKRETRNWN